MAPDHTAPKSIDADVAAFFHAMEAVLECLRWTIRTATATRRAGTIIFHAASRSREAMNNLSEQITELISSIRALQARTHSEIGLVGAAIIEEQLLRALLTKMRPLSGEMKKRLFDGYGPLSSFAAKIDLSYALQIINKAQYDDLTVIRRIRNQFAHAMPLINFDSPEIRAHFKSFNTVQEGETDYRAFYLRKLQEIDRHLDNAIGEADQLSNSQGSSEHAL